MKTYTCTHCGETYEQGWTEEEARAEAQAAYGDVPPEELSTVCDECHKGFMAWWQGMETPERDRWREKLQERLAIVQFVQKIERQAKAPETSPAASQLLSRIAQVLKKKDCVAEIETAIREAIVHEIVGDFVKKFTEREEK